MKYCIDLLICLVFFIKILYSYIYIVHILFRTSNSIFRKQSVRLNDFRFVAKMDPKYSAQDVARCDLCKTAIAHNYCDFCHVNLCKPCIGEHISKEYEKHKIVPILQRKSTLIYSKCGTHQDTGL